MHVRTSIYFEQYVRQTSSVIECPRPCSIPPVKKLQFLRNLVTYQTIYMPLTEIHLILTQEILEFNKSVVLYLELMGEKGLIAELRHASKRLLRLQSYYYTQTQFLTLILNVKQIKMVICRTISPAKCSKFWGLIRRAPKMPRELLTNLNDSLLIP